MIWQNKRAIDSQKSDLFRHLTIIYWHRLWNVGVHFLHLWSHNALLLFRGTWVGARISGHPSGRYRVVHPLYPDLFVRDMNWFKYKTHWAISPFINKWVLSYEIKIIPSFRITLILSFLYETSKTYWYYVWKRLMVSTPW